MSRMQLRCARGGLTMFGLIFLPPVWALGGDGGQCLWRAPLFFRLRHQLGEESRSTIEKLTVAAFKRLRRKFVVRIHEGGHHFERRRRLLSSPHQAHSELDSAFARKMAELETTQHSVTLSKPTRQAGAHARGERAPPRKVHDVRHLILDQVRSRLEAAPGIGLGISPICLTLARLQPPSGINRSGAEYCLCEGRYDPPVPNRLGLSGEEQRDAPSNAHRTQHSVPNLHFGNTAQLALAV